MDPYGVVIRKPYTQLEARKIESKKYKQINTYTVMLVTLTFSLITISLILIICDD